MMTPEQIRLVRDSFPGIAELSRPIALLFYGRLFEVAPEVQPMFKQDIAVQGRKLMEMLTALVTNLDQFEEMEPALKALGQRHAGYGVQPDHYPMVAAALIWAFGLALEGEFSPDLKAAWLAVIEAVAAVMKSGAASLASI
jgi:hemoglobin-like flavoprotein